MIAVKVYLGSYWPEFYLYDERDTYLRYWSLYHDGPLPCVVKAARGDKA